MKSRSIFQSYPQEIAKSHIKELFEEISGVDLRKALDAHFRDLKLGEPTPEDYQLLDRTIATIQEGIWTSDEHDFDYNKLKADIYEALLDGRRAKTKELEIYVGEDGAVERDRAVIGVTFDWLRCILR